jgi:tetratricopeptide (TPR) repeat protein
MTTPRQDETSARLHGFEARLESVFAWLTESAREVTIAIVAFLVIGAGSAGLYEYWQHQERAAHTALAAVERQFIADGGIPAGDRLGSAGADSERVRTARENALANLEAMIEEHAGTNAAVVASIRAAEMEMDLDQLEAANTRLTALLEDLAEDDGLRGVALRLQGYVLETLGRQAEAAEAYAAAGAVTSYGDRAGVWLSAAGAFERAGANQRAIAAYQEVVTLDPALADGWGIANKLDALIAEDLGTP